MINIGARDWELSKIRGERIHLIHGLLTFTNQPSHAKAEKGGDSASILCPSENEQTKQNYLIVLKVQNPVF